jgi:hypothetical protein
MFQLLAITRNTFLQTLRQPVFGIVVIVALGSMALAPSLTGWTLDDDNKLLRDLGLSTLLIQGLFLACFGASNAIDVEIEDKTILTVAAKPLARWLLVIGKYFGLIGAIAATHYLTSIAFFMAMRHGVLQSSAEKSDLTVVALGPGVMLLVVIAATALNYVLEWRFLPTLVNLALPAMTLAGAVLLVFDRDWRIQSWEITQTMDDLPVEAQDPASFKGIVEFHPLVGDQQIQGHRGFLVRSAIYGPISPAEQDYLLNLSDSQRWKKDINFLAETSRGIGGMPQRIEIGKAILLIMAALAVLTAIAVASSARIGMVGTFLVCLMALSAGLCSDQLLRPLMDEGAAWAQAAYRVIPNFQVFWMVDALSDEQVIPWRYVGKAWVYAGAYVTAALLAGMALFETREVG